MTDAPKPAAAAKTEAARLIAAAVAAGRTQGDIAAFLSRTLVRQYKNYHVSRMVSGGREIKADELDALRQLSTGEQEPARDAFRLLDSGGDVPLFGYGSARGGVLRISEEQRVGVVPMHPAQKGTKGAFAFVVFGNKLADRLRHGETAYAVQHKIPIPNEPVLVQLADGEATPMIYDRQDENTVFGYELSPKRKDISFPLRDVAGLHRIVGAAFGPG